MRLLARLGLIGLSLAVAPTLTMAPGAALAAGGGGGSGGWAAGTVAEGLEEASQLIETARYEDAISILEGVVADDPGNADAYNWLGYTHRQLGRYDEAMTYYEQALAIDSDHRGALEYLGEAYLAMGDLAAAEAMLERLDSACWFGCDELEQLEQAIEEYRAQVETN